jgi:hypothetical protein
MAGGPPTTIDGAVVQKYVWLGHREPTGNTRHFVGGEQVVTFAALAIASYEGDEGIYLFYCDEQWETVTDTFHLSVDDALHQAEVEFGPVTLLDA